MRVAVAALGVLLLAAACWLLAACVFGAFLVWAAL
jgi:hypothetical protein